MSAAPDCADGIPRIIDLRPELPHDLTRRRAYLEAVIQFTHSRQRRAAAMAELDWMTKQFSGRG